VKSVGAASGYVFVRDVYCYPEWYARGLPNEPFLNHDARPIRMEIGDWFWHCDERLWSRREPVIRDVYATNLLSSDHLASATVDGKTLGDWIGGATGRGRLESVGPDRWLWILDDLEIFHARAGLMDAGRLFSNLPRVYRDLSPAYSAPRFKPLCFDPGPFRITD